MDTSNSTDAPSTDKPDTQDLSLLELVAAAQATAKTHEDRIAELLSAMDGQNGSDAEIEDLRAATLALELATVDIYAVFEARMQHHFKRGPFSRKLKTLLLNSQQPDLADRIHQYYLAINVLKHGTGASHRELLNSPSTLIVVKSSDNDESTESLIDVTAPGFFEGLTATIIDATNFLEKK